jgi:dTDP-4-amino-4,6-dideoxygalactose transaminase
MQVPYVDLRAQYQRMKSEIDEAIHEVIGSSAFSGGPFVQKFEEEFARYCECEHCVGVGSGTEAIWLILLALGVGVGDEVITVPNTFIATVEAIRFCGATPILIDVDPRTYTMDPGRLEGAITGKTKAVIPVHLFGQTADMDPIVEICRKKGLRVIEDACQAHGAEYKQRRAGSLGDAAAFSFYPGKNLGAYGEAGAAVTNERELANKIRMIRDHGQTRKYHHEIYGWNARMDGIQGSILSAKLKHLQLWNEARITVAEKYSRHLDTRTLVTPYKADYAKHVFHIYAVRVPERDVVLEKLKEKGISCGIHYPIAIHQQKAYGTEDLPRVERHPVAEDCARNLLSLPMFAELEDNQIDYVCSQLNAVVSEFG